MLPIFCSSHMPILAAFTFLLFASVCLCFGNFTVRVVHYDEYTFDDLSLVPAFISSLSTFIVVCECENCKSVSITHSLNISFELTKNYSHYEWRRIEQHSLTDVYPSIGNYSCVFDESVHVSVQVAYAQCVYTKNNENCNNSVCITDGVSPGCQRLTTDMCQTTHNNSSQNVVVCSQNETFPSLCEALRSYVFNKIGGPPLYQISGNMSVCLFKPDVHYYSIFMSKNRDDCKGDLVEVPLGSTYHLDDEFMMLCYVVPRSTNLTICRGTVVLEQTFFCHKSPSCTYALNRTFENGDIDKFTFTAINEQKEYFTYFYVVYIGNIKPVISSLGKCEEHPHDPLPGLQCDLKFHSEKLIEQITVSFSWNPAKIPFEEGSTYSKINISESGIYICTARMVIVGYDFYKNRIQNTTQIDSEPYEVAHECHKHGVEGPPNIEYENVDVEPPKNDASVVTAVVVVVVLLALLIIIVVVVIVGMRRRSKQKKAIAPKQGTSSQVGSTAPKNTSSRKDLSSKQCTLSKQGP